MNKTIIAMTAIFVFIVIFSMNASASVSIENKTIGYSYQKRAIIATVIKDTSCQDNKVYTFTTQQHGTEWSGREVVNGMVNELIENKDSIECKEYHFILNSNPDGIKANTMLNVKGINLNRVWNLWNGKEYEISVIRSYLKNLDNVKQIDIFADVHGYNGGETQSEIMYADDKSKQVCSDDKTDEFNCVKSTAPIGSSRWYMSSQLKVPVVLTIEPVQKMVSWSRTKYQDIGKRLIDLI